MTVYLDLVIVLNILVDLLLLIAANRLTGHPCIPWRIISASVIGGIYAGLCMIRTFAPLGSLPLRLISLAVMSCTAFGINRTLLQRCAVFSFLCMGMGGICEAIGADDIFTLICIAVSVLILCRFAFQGGVGQRKYVRVHMEYLGNVHQVTALVDTGNTLTDPISGTQVIVAGAEAAMVLLGLSENQLRDPIGTMQTVGMPGLRLIPYRSVGNSMGMLLAAKMDSVRIEGREAGNLVAFTADSFQKGDAYQALTGGAI